EGRATLVVDEQEGDALRGVGRRHAEDPGLEQLGLAGTGGAADEGVRAVGADVDGEGALTRLADDGAQVAGLAGQHGWRVRTGEDRARLAPLLDDGLLGAREVGAREGEERDGAGQVARVVDGDAGVDDRRELAGAG